MQSLNFLHCKLCTNAFSISNKPLLLKCGHTFCEKCLKGMIEINQVICPHDQITNDITSLSELQVNYSVQEAVETYKGHNGRLCHNHPNNFIKFFCKTHTSNLCQECLIQHLGSGHDVVSNEDIVQIDPLKKRAKELLDKIEIENENIGQRAKEHEEDFNKNINDLKNMKKNLEDLINKNYENIYKKSHSNFEQESEEIQQQFDKLTYFSNKLKEISDFVNTNFPNHYEYIMAETNAHTLKLKEYEEVLQQVIYNKVVTTKKNMFFIGAEPLLLSKSDMREIIELQIPHYDPKMKKLLNGLKEDGIIKSDIVFNTMMIVNRKNFMPEDSGYKAYQDSPLSIGWNTTISAPHMHATTLEEIKDHLKKAKRSLDIGCGSGYMTACMSEIMGPNTITIGIDHIEDIIKFAVENVNKKNPYLFENGRLKLIKADGRKGFKDFEPYDVIHVGGALAVVPKELEDQLACGGRMWIPVGTQGRQSIYLVDKDLNGKITNKKLLDVAYGLLTTVENQLQQSLY